MSSPEPRAVRWFSPLVAALAVMGAVLLTWWVAHDGETAFVSTPQFLVWVLLFAAQIVVWAAGYVIVVRELAAVWPSGPWRGLAAILKGPAAAVLAFLVFSLTIVPTYGTSRDKFPFTKAYDNLPAGEEWPLADAAGRLTVATGVAILLALLAVLGMFLVRGRLLALAAKKTVEDRDLSEFLALRARMLRLLAVVGVSIGIGTLVIGALKQAMDASVPAPSNRAQYCAQVEDADLRTLEYCEDAPKPAATTRTIDDNFIILFGLYYSGLLMLAFAPVYVAFLVAGRNLVDRRLARHPRPSGFTAREAKRTELESALQLNVGAATTFKSSVAVFAPLFASLVSLLLGTG